MSNERQIRDLFYDHSGNLVHKWDHYLDVYQSLLAKYQGKSPKILEIGISHGGSIQLWKKFFGEGCEIFAIDINEDCKKLEEDNVTIFIGSQEDEQFLTDVASKIPDLDFILDDGGHYMNQQILTFNTLFKKVIDGGYYIVEDTHTSYWPEFGGGVRREGTFIEYSKKLIDALYEHHLFDNEGVRIDSTTQYINSIAFYDSIVVFEKKRREKPFHKQIGNKTITPYVPTPAPAEPKSFIEKVSDLFKPKEAKPHPFERNDGNA